jgi:hypothetical protein
VGLGLDEIDGGKLNRLDDTFALQYRYFNCWSIFPIHKQTTYCKKKNLASLGSVTIALGTIQLRGR